MAVHPMDLVSPQAGLELVVNRDVGVAPTVPDDELLPLLVSGGVAVRVRIPLRIKDGVCYRWVHRATGVVRSGIVRGRTGVRSLCLGGTPAIGVRVRRVRVVRVIAAIVIAVPECDGSLGYRDVKIVGELAIVGVRVSVVRVPRVRVPGAHPRVSTITRVLRPSSKSEVLSRADANLPACPHLEIVVALTRNTRGPAGLQPIEEVPRRRLRIVVRAVRLLEPVVVGRLAASDRVE